MKRAGITGLIAALALASAGAWAAAVDKTPAKLLFAREQGPTEGAPRPVGFYAKGCLAGAKSLPIDGPDWQVMRLSRNRHWGMPVLVSYIETLARDAHENAGWPGLLIGDMSQPRGGPMPTGHASHQIGLDADIWLTPMPDHTLTAEEREKKAAMSLLIPGHLAVDPAKWSDRYVRLYKQAVSYPEVARIFVSAAIKQKLCESAGPDRAWLRKIRPWWGHDDHFHVRLQCPAGLAGCAAQPDPPPGDGCGEELANWFKPHPPPKVPPKPAPEITLADLPSECTRILSADPNGVKPGEVATPVPKPRPAVD